MEYLFYNNYINKHKNKCSILYWYFNSSTSLRKNTKNKGFNTLESLYKYTILIIIELRHYFLELVPVSHLKYGHFKCETG